MNGLSEGCAIDVGLTSMSEVAVMKLGLISSGMMLYPKFQLSILCLGAGASTS